MRKLTLHHVFKQARHILGGTTSYNVEINNPCIITTGPKRFYSLDPNKIPKGLFETVPYTKRTCFILSSVARDRDEGLKLFEASKQDFEGKILDYPLHPYSVRVTKVFNNIIDALHREMSKMRSSSLDTSEYTILGRLWLWITGRSPPSLSHLDGLNWEVLIVNYPHTYASCCPGGKIVLSTALLEHHASDPELAFILAHEVAHRVARHEADRYTRSMWITTMELFLNLFVTIDFAKRVFPLVDFLPFNRRCEMEADYIGLLLAASAGYDPRLALKAFEKFPELPKYDKNSKLVVYITTHPSRKKRAKVLARPRVMEEALTLYNDAREKRGG